MTSELAKTDSTVGPNNRCLSVVMPAFNEGVTLRRIVEKLVSIPYLLEVIIVDDCSTDNTADVA